MEMLVFLNNLIQLLLKYFQEWHSYSLIEKSPNIRLLTWSLLVHVQYHGHIFWLYFFLKEKAQYETTAEKIVVVSISLISLVADLSDKVITYFELMLLRRRRKLNLVVKVINILIGQILFLITIETLLKNKDVLSGNKFDEFSKLFINYSVCTVLLATGSVKWKYLLCLNLIIYLLYHSVVLLRLKTSDMEFQSKNTTSWCLDALVTSMAFSLLYILSRNASSQEIYQRIFENSLDGKIILKNKEIISINYSLKIKFLRKESVSFEDLSKIVFHRYTHTHNSKSSSPSSTNSRTKSRSNPFLKTTLILPEILEILKTAPPNGLTLYTNFKKPASSQFDSSPISPITRLSRKYQIVLTEAALTSEDEFSDILFQKVQAKIMYLDLKRFGNEYVLIEFKDFSEVQTVIEFDKIIEYKTNILNSFSHELKTPLNNSKNLAEMLLSEESLSKGLKDKFLKPVQTSLNMLDFLIHDIVDFLKIETDQLELEIITFDLKTLIMEAVDMFTERGGEKQIQFQLSLSELESCQIKTDRSRLRRCVNNILSFLIKTNERIQLIISVQEIEDGGFKLSIMKKPLADLNIEPTCGISLINTIDRKYHLSKELEFLNENDIRLIISKMILENLLHSGLEEFVLSEGEENECFFTASFSSVQAKESDVYFPVSHNLRSLDILERNFKLEANLPALDSKSSKQAHIKDTASHIECVFPDCPQALIVDDDQFNIMSLDLILGKLNTGITTLKATNGIEAIEIYQKHQLDHRCQNPACQGLKVILMDLMMPIMNGMESCQILLEMMDHGIVPRVPIFACTANDSKDMMKACKNIGFTGFISKPIDPFKLRSELADVLNFD